MQLVFVEHWPYVWCCLVCSKLPTFQIQINNYRPHMSAPPYQSWLLVSFLDSCVPPVAPLPTSTLRAGLWPQENPIHICLPSSVFRIGLHFPASQPSCSPQIHLRAPASSRRKQSPRASLQSKWVVPANCHTPWWLLIHMSQCLSQDKRGDSFPGLVPHFIKKASEEQMSCLVPEETALSTFPPITQFIRKTWRTDIWNGPSCPTESLSFLTHICIPLHTFASPNTTLDSTAALLHFCHVSQSFRNLPLCKFRFSNDATGSEIKHSSGQRWGQTWKGMMKI